MVIRFSLSIVFILLYSQIYSQSGSLDLTFSSDGKATASFGSGDDFANAIAYQTDGKIVVAGKSFNGTDYDVAILRYNANGILDNTFSQDGKQTTPVGTLDDDAEALIIRPNGKIVIAGATLISGFNNDFVLVQYNSDGTIDNNFGIDGIVKIDFGDNDGANCIALHSDGKIVVAGVSGNFDFKLFAIARINSDGSLDNTFSNDGKETTQIGDYMNFANDIAIANDGKIIVAGTAYNNNETNFAVLVRYNIDGTIDYTFGSDGNGRVYCDQGADDNFNSIAILNDGKILAAGNSYIDDNKFDDILLARYTPDGLIDNSFGTNGIVLTDYCTNDYGNSLIVQQDNKIVVAGGSIGCPAFVLSRYNENGALDNSFGNSGILTTDFGTNDETASCIAKQDDGKLIVAGYRNNGSSYDFAVARYDNLLSDIPTIDASNTLLDVYPNPAQSTLSIRLDSNNTPTTVTLLNAFGQTVLSAIMHDNNSSLDLNNITNGIYIAQININGILINRKIVVEK
jgi:uncharacterized delta-60 repeat protein